MGATLNQLVEYQKLDIKLVIYCNKYNNFHQKWDVAEKGQNEEPIKF